MWDKEYKNKEKLTQTQTQKKQTLTQEQHHFMHCVIVGKEEYNKLLYNLTVGAIIYENRFEGITQPRMH